MAKEDDISNCKQEELTSTLLIMCTEIIVFGFVFPSVQEELFLLSVLLVFISIGITFFIFWHSNKGMMLCYKLVHGNGIIKNAVVEKYKVTPFRTSFCITVWFRILETGNVYKWKEQYCESEGFHHLASQINHYLGHHPELDVLVDPDNYARHYILFEQVMLDKTRKTQGVSKVINRILGIILLVIFIAFVVKLCITCA